MSLSSRRPGLFSAFLGFWLFAAVGSAWSHPHEFVTLRTEARFDDSGKLASMRYNWTFDEFFSAYALEGHDKNKNGRVEQEEVDAVHAEILGNIHSIDYFTAFDGNAVVPKIDKATAVEAKLVDRKLVVIFDVPFKEPVSLSGKSMRYSIYDGEFYIAMNHDTEREPVTLVNAPDGCSATMADANPDEDLVAFANSLSKNDSAGNDLGLNFAEWVTLKCK